MSRVFGVSLSIPEPHGSTLTWWRCKVGDPLAASVPPHVTLLPPTQLDVADVDASVKHLSAVAATHTSFDLHLRGTGTFRPISDVVFIAIARGISECELLAADVRNGALDRSLQFPYHPHVTVAHGLEHEQLDEAFLGLASFEATFPVDRFTLFEQGADLVWRPMQDFVFADALEHSQT